MKKIGFLSFGHWSDSHGSQVRSGLEEIVEHCLCEVGRAVKEDFELLDLLAAGGQIIFT